MAQEFYDRFYGDATDSLRQWRLLGAINKSQSVLDLTADLRIRDVIDIGSGTGALLELLAPLRPTWRFERIPNTIGHLRFCSRREWDRLFADNGLTILRRRQYTVQKEVLFFGKHGAGLIEERVKLLGQRILGRRIWADLYHSNYAVLAKGVH